MSRGTECKACALHRTWSRGEDSFSHATQQGQFPNYLEPDISTQKAASHPLPPTLPELPVDSAARAAALSNVL
jgi:hypothetical protein